MPVSIQLAHWHPLPCVQQLNQKPRQSAGSKMSAELTHLVDSVDIGQPIKVRKKCVEEDHNLCGADVLQK